MTSTIIRAKTPLIGDFGVVATGGWEAKLIRWGTDSPVNHAFVYIGGDQIVEAQPGGAVISPVAKYPAESITWGGPTINAYGEEVADEAKRLVGVGYNWLDIAAIALAQKRLGRLIDSDSLIAQRISSDGTLICSQLVDLAYHLAGIELFDDGRLPGLVSPGDLLNLIPAGGPQ